MEQTLHPSGKLERKNLSKKINANTILVLLSSFLLIISASVNAQTGYIYVHSKTLNETGTPSITYTVTGGSTVVPNFTLNDDPAQTPVQDMGAAENGRLWAISRSNVLYYRDVNSTVWINTGVSTVGSGGAGTAKIDGGPGGTCYYINTAGTAFSYTGSGAPTQISATNQFANSGGWNDIASGWTGTSTAGTPAGPALYVVNDNATVQKYDGAGAASTDWNTYATITGFSGYRVDVNPTNGNVYVAGNTSTPTVRTIRQITPGLVQSNLGSPVAGLAQAFRDIAVNQNGEIFATIFDNQWYVSKYVSGTSWTTEQGSFDASNLTGGLGNAIWVTMNSGGWNGGSGWPPASGPYPFYNIFSRGFDGTSPTYIDDERVRTTAGNSQLIPVAPGTYTITETIPGGWDLQKVLVYDPSANSSSNQVAGTATITVAANEVVNVVFQTGELNPIAMTNNCSAAYLETFGVGTSVGTATTAGSYGAPVAGQTSYHYLTGNAPGEDGYYKIVNRANPDFNSWGSALGIVDHTPGDGSLGYMYAVNAGFDKGEFFRRRFTGVIPGASYNFSAWIVNLTASAPVNPNVSFTVYDHTTQLVLGTYNTGELSNNTDPGTWQQYGFSFVATASDIDLVVGNNGFGGSGNDLAIDDISFALIPSGTPVTTVVNSSCSTLGSITVTSPTGSSFEYSKDGTNWQSSTSFTNLVPGVYTTYARFVGTVSCVTSKTDTIQAAICGNVFNDTNGLTDNTVNGTGTNVGGTLIAVIYDNTTGKVVDTAYVTASGTYTLHALLGDNYTVYLTTTPATIGQTTIPVVTLPTGWVRTGEIVGTGTGTNTPIDGILAIGVLSNSVTNINFGIEQPPVAVADQSLNNTTGTPVTINPLTNDTDGTPGTLNPTTVSLVVPVGATNVVTDGNGDVTSMTIPGQGTWTVDPTTGAIIFTPQIGFNGNPTVQQYNVEDNAGVVSNNANLTITYLAPITITGTVINDVNGNTLLDFAETGTTAGINLYVYLVNAIGIVVDSAKVLPNGTYILDAGQNLNYTIELSTIQYPVGTNTTTTPIVNTPTTGWLTTGENGAGNSGAGDLTPDGTLAVSTGTINVTNQNFGIQQPPIAVTYVMPSQLNPGGTTNFPIPYNYFYGYDAIGSGGFATSMTITSFPANATSITVNGITYYPGTFPVGGLIIPTTSKGNPIWAIAVDPIDGNVDVVFNYFVTDNGGATSPDATLTIPFTNDTPTANPNTSTTNEDTPVTVPVLPNDTFGGDGPSTGTITITDQPNNGSATVNDGGTPNNPTDDQIVYTPNPNFNGNDTLIYQICDSNGDCDTALVVITVAPVNDVPTANPNTSTTTEDTPVTVSVLPNDTFGGDGPSTGTITITDQPNNGTAVVNDGGTPNNPTDDQIVYTPNPNYNGNDTLIYQICDSNGDCDTALVVITIAPVNDVPTANPNTSTTNEDTPVTVPVLTNDTFGGDGPSTGTITITDQPNNGTATVNNGGTPTDPTDDQIVYTPNPNYNGNDTLIYLICDSNGDCDTALVVITIDPVNDVPTANPDYSTTQEDTPVTVPVVTNNDTFGGDGPSVTTISITDQPNNGTATVNDGGTPNDPTDDQIVYTPNPDFYGTDTLIYQICDSDAGSVGLGARPSKVLFVPIAGDCDTALVVITIDPVNDVPVANPNTSTTNEDTPVTVPVLPNDTFGGDGPSTGTITITDQPNNGTATVNNGGTPTDPTDDQIVYTPNPNYNGNDTLIYQICDSNGDCDTALVVITIAPVNDVPTANPNTSTTNEDTLVTVPVLTNDTFGGDGPSTGTITITDQPNNGTATVNNGGTPTDPTDDQIVYTPNPNYNGNDTLIYQICDSNGDCDTALVVITIAPVNDVPTANPNTSTTNEDTPVTVSVLTNDTFGGDGPSTGTITITDQPNNGTATVNNGGTPTDPTDDQIVYTPNPNYNGNDTLIYQICDSNGDCDTALVVITIAPVNDVPTANPNTSTTTEDTPVTVPVLTNDTFGGDGPSTGTITITDQPNNGTVIMNDGGTPTDPTDDQITYTPNLNYNGNDTLIYQICDSNGDCDTALVVITINAAGPILPVKLISFNATPQNNNVLISWKVSSEINMKKYEIEFSKDGMNFSKVGGEVASNSTNYSFLHSVPVSGKNYYRLKSISADGKFEYSQIALVRFDKSGSINVYPNPVQYQLNILLSDSWINKQVKVEMYDQLGQLVVSKQIKNTQQTEQLPVNHLASGPYILKLQQADNTVDYKKIQIVN